jgi:hypothetical protein
MAGGKTKDRQRTGLSGPVFGRRRKNFAIGGDQGTGWKLHPGCKNLGRGRVFVQVSAEIGLPVECFHQAFARIRVSIVAEGRLLTTFELHDPFHCRFGGVIILVIGVSIVIVVIRGKGAADAQIEYLQGDDP